MKNLLFYLCLAAAFLLKFNDANAQVTIGAGTPPADYSVLEISTVETKGGLRLPQVKDNNERQTIQNMFAASPENAKGLVIYNLANKNLEYWDGTQWISIKAQVLFSGVNGLSTNGNSIELGGTLGKATTLNLGANNLNFTSSGGAVGIGTSSPNSSALLELNSSNKGFLLPRVALTSTTSASPITSPARGLIVYNMANASSGSTIVQADNLYTWDGTKWSQLVNQATFDNTLQSALNNLGVPRPAVFQLENNISNFLNGIVSGGSTSVPMSMLTNNLPDDISFNAATNTVTFKRGGLYTMTFVYEAEHNATECNLASYIVDFPDMNGGRGTTPSNKFTRIHSTAAFNQGALSNHGGTITCTAFVTAGRTWKIGLGRGQSGNCMGTGATLIGKSTHFVITKVGN